MPVRHERTVGFSSKFIGYKCHSTRGQNGCTVSFTRYQTTKGCQVVEIFASKVRVAKNMRDVLRKCTQHVLNIKKSLSFFCLSGPRMTVLAKFYKNPSTSFYNVAMVIQIFIQNVPHVKLNDDFFSSERAHR